MVFEKGSKIRLIVDRDIERDRQLHDAFLQGIANIDAMVGTIDIKRDIEYRPLGLDSSVVGATPDQLQAILKAWQSFKDRFHESESNHNTVLVVLEDLGSSASGGHRNVGGVRTGIVTLPKVRLAKKRRQEKIDLIQHEFLHAIGIPHIQGPFMIEGFFDNQATMHDNTNYPGLEIYEPNMDPSSSDEAIGLQASDIHAVNYFYPQEKEDYIKVNIDFAYTGMNCALIGRSRKSPMSGSVAMPTIDGVANFYIPKNGKWSINLRPSSTKGGSFSSVWRDGDPQLFGEYWFRKKRGNKLIFRPATKKKHKLKKIKLKKDKEYIAIIEH